MADSPSGVSAVLLSVDAVLAELPDPPLATSRRRAWAGVTVDVHGPAPALDYRAAPRDHHVIVHCHGGSARLAQERCGERDEGPLHPGSVILWPAGTSCHWRGALPAQTRLRISPALLERAVEVAGRRGAEDFALANRFRCRDAFIERAAQWLREELAQPPHPAQALIGEGIAHALAAHLTRSHDARAADAAIPPPALGRQALARVLAYIEDHPGPIALADLAALARVSRFHFCRLFKASTGVSPMAYVERSRIRKARRLLLQGGLPLAEVALAAGFADQSHFTRRFRRHVGCTPAVFARNPEAAGGDD